MDQHALKLIKEFINIKVTERGLDDRTARAYSLDLELFYQWEEEMEDQSKLLEEKMEMYLSYLFDEKGLCFSTIVRKYRVFQYYLLYLKTQGMGNIRGKINLVQSPKPILTETLLTKDEIDRFFAAIRREYEELNSDFRKRICLRDEIMMEFLFYHKLEISELLRLEISDYNRKTAVLRIHRKQRGDRTVYLFSKKLQRQLIMWLSEHVNFEHEELYRNRMFLSKLGKPISMKMVINIFEKYRILAGIEKECSPKDLKNSLGRYAEEMLMELG